MQILDQRKGMLVFIDTGDETDPLPRPVHKLIDEKVEQWAVTDNENRIIPTYRVIIVGLDFGYNDNFAWAIREYNKPFDPLIDFESARRILWQTGDSVMNGGFILDTRTGGYSSNT